MFGTLSIMIVAGGAIVVAGGGFGEAAELVSVIGTLTGVGGFVFSGVQTALILRPPALPTAQDAAASEAEVLDGLATAVRRQWEQEARSRALLKPAPMELTWRATERRVAAAPVAILGGSVGGNPIRLRFSGDLEDSARKFLSLPKRQLVIIGAPGGGKTVMALLLTLRILEKRAPGDPVPVLLSLVTWQPRRMDLHTWMVQRIAEDYPALRGETLRDLVVDGRVLPVLDGLDELPVELHGPAIDGINEVIGHGPLVVTCRSAEYEAAVQAAGVLAGAAVIELEPVRPGDALSYLETGAAPYGDRWRAVREHIRAHPDAAPARVLSTPLMVTLARDVYRSSGNPDELLDFPDAAAIENHLLDQAIPAAFGPRAGRARAWLGFLAVHMERLQTRDLAWWQIRDMIALRPVHLLFLGIIAVINGVAGYVIFSVVVDQLVGMIGGGVLALATAASAFVQVRFDSSEAPPRRFVVFLDRQPWRSKVGAMLIGGVVPGVAAGASMTVGVGAEAGLIAGFLAAVAGAVINGLIRWSKPADNVEAVDPRSVMTGDRGATLAQGIMVGVAFALAAVVAFVLFGSEEVRADTLVPLVVGAFVIGFPFALDKAWPWYRVSHLWLALRGRLPWRFMAFLDEAYRLQVLRRAGAVYQFRHGTLQERLGG